MLCSYAGVDIFRDESSVICSINVILKEQSDECKFAKLYLRLGLIPKLFKPQFFTMAEAISFTLAPVH